MRYILDLDFWHILWPNFQKAFMISLLKSIFLMSDKLFWFVSTVKGEHPQDLQFECLPLRPFLRSIDQRLFIAMLLNVWKWHLPFLCNFFVQCLILSYLLGCLAYECSVNEIFFAGVGGFDSTGAFFLDAGEPGLFIKGVLID